MNILKTQYTPGGKLRDTLDRCVNSTMNADGGKSKIVELAGKPILAGLRTSVNFGGNAGCQMASNGNECIIGDEEDCRCNRCIYGIDCIPCLRDPNKQQARYVGTTARTAHSRQIEHKRAILGRNASNALVKHQINEHPQDIPQFMASIIKGGFRWNLERQIFEALEIEHTRMNPNMNVLNQKSEWGHRALPRLIVAD